MLLIVDIRWLLLAHLDRHDAERPDVDLRFILFLLHNFGRHPVWGAYHRCALGLLIGQLSAKAKVGYKKRIRLDDRLKRVMVRNALILTRPAASRSTLSDLMSRWMIC